MDHIILVIHIFLALAIIGVVLLQPPENSSLGGLGSSNTMAGTSGRGQGNLLTRMTAILATAFIITSLVLALLAGHKPNSGSILDDADSAPALNAPQDPVKKETSPLNMKEEAPKTAPSVPLSK